jgi:3-deoxy-D-manno-octulosonate 8-phosphate phosphatase KdsC-like HAD superfamily phosphatase
MAPYTNKGYAVKELCSYLQINMDDVYTIGDRKIDFYLCLIPLDNSSDNLVFVRV